MTDQTDTSARVSPLYDPKVRSIVFQTLLLAVIAFLVYSAFTNMVTNLQQRNISQGFDFWNNAAGFDINQTLIDYSATSTYGKAFWVGLLNTLLVASIGCVLATLLGFTMGVLRLSSNFIVAKIAMIYVEVVRNLPLLLQLLFWYNAVLKPLPNPRNSIAIPAVHFGQPDWTFSLTALFGLLAGWQVYKISRKAASATVLKNARIVSFLVMVFAICGLVMFSGALSLANSELKPNAMQSLYFGGMFVGAAVTFVLAKPRTALTFATAAGIVGSLLMGSSVISWVTESGVFNVGKPLGVYLNNRGLVIPQPVYGESAWLIGAAAIAALVGAFVYRMWADARQRRTGARAPVGYVSVMLIIGLPLLAYLVAGRPVSFNFPELKGFNYQGGLQVYPEFVALLLGLVFYTGAFIAEIVRAGIMAVSKGQTEAAYAVGLQPRQTLKLVVIPQALRVIIPPLTSQYLNLTKNSSLAVFIGYPDLVQIFTGTVLNQTGQAVEVVAITMLVYLTISLSTASFMNWYNARKALVER